MKQLEPKENQSPETEEEAWTDVPGLEGMLLGQEPPEGSEPPPEEELQTEEPCPCPCPCGEE